MLTSRCKQNICVGSTKNTGHMIMNEDTAERTSNASNKIFRKINSKIENLKGKYMYCNKRFSKEAIFLQCHTQILSQCS